MKSKGQPRLDGIQFFDNDDQSAKHCSIFGNDDQAIKHCSLSQYSADWSSLLKI